MVPRQITNGTGSVLGPELDWAGTGPCVSTRYRQDTWMRMYKSWHSRLTSSNQPPASGQGTISMGLKTFVPEAEARICLDWLICFKFARQRSQGNPYGASVAHVYTHFHMVTAMLARAFDATLNLAAAERTWHVLDSEDIRQPRPDSGLGFQVKVFQTLLVSPVSLCSGRRAVSLCSGPYGLV